MMLISADQLAKAMTKYLRYTLLVRPYTSVPGTVESFAIIFIIYPNPINVDFGAAHGDYSEQVGNSPI
jgi:hypothetical protein